MFKLSGRTLLFILAMLFVSMGMMAQSKELPVDTAVRIGKLPNGLTYYIRHNETPKGQADFYIAQKVGSILEEDNQRGLAHFLEHMCFNGTTNFPGNSLITWLESKGVKFGYNLNAYTSIDETVYNISNVPVANKAVQDSCLLILHDWANDLLLDPEEIDKERGVIHQEWRRSMVGQMRILENLLPVIYPDNKYGYRLPIGTMEVVDNFPPQALRDYYETWYRPDQQGIVVVGDIDVDYIEGKIKEMFSSIEMPENAKPREYVEVEDTEGTIYAIGSDPEQTTGILELIYKQDAFPDELKGDPNYLIYKYVNNIMTQMLDQRLSDIGKNPDAPYAAASVDYGNFFLAKTKEALSLDAVAKGDDILPAFEAAYRELLRAQRGGFTEGEYSRAKAEYLSRLEKAYNSRDNRESEAYVKEYVRHFIDNEPIPSIEDEYAIMNEIINMVPLQLINSLLNDYITEDNRVVLVLAPQNDTFKIPTEEKIAAVMAKVEAEEIEPYEDAMKAEPLIPELPAPGKVVSVTDDAQWGAKVVTLSNGVKVYVKPTDFKKDEILFAAQAVGGSSVVSDDQANNLIFMPLAMGQYGLGDYTSTDLERYLKGKQVDLDLSISEYERSLSGTSTVKDLPTLMELIYMTFIGYNFDPTEFEALQKQYSSILANQASNPQVIFSTDLLKTIYESPASQMVTSEIIEASDRQGILDIIHSQIANAADFKFYFVGDINMDALLPLLEQYIATLPADAANTTTTWTKNLSREVKPGIATDTFTAKMETPQSYCALLIEGNLDYTPANRMLSSIAGQILSNRYLNKIREEMGAVYSIGASGSMSRTGEYNTIMQTSFPMKPELKDEVLVQLHDIVFDMTENIGDDELNPIKEYMVKDYTEMKDKNNGWIGAMSATSINGVDFFTDVVDTINAITTDDVKAFMKQLLDQNNYRVIVLDPEQ